MSVHNSAEFISDIRRNSDKYYIIHYSCQSLYDDNEQLSPRITSIAITHFASEQTISFSTHSIAEELHIVREDVMTNFDKIEFLLLEKFYLFIQERKDKFWIHWNMRNLTYGFEHLEHRFNVLGGKFPTIIPVENRINLNDILSDRYGGDYAEHPKLKSLMILNGGIHRHFLTGKEEVEAFQQNKFIRMHNSTLSKVGFFHLVIRKMIHGKLKVASRGFGVFIDRIFESRSAKIIAFFATIISLPATIWQIYLWVL